MERNEYASTLSIKAKEFLETRKHASNLEEILEGLYMEDTASECISLLEMIFMVILKRRSMFLKEHVGDEPSQNVVSLRRSYNVVWHKLLSMLSHESFGEKALRSLFTLLRQEGKFPIVVRKKGHYYFPIDKLKLILRKCFSLHSNLAVVQRQLDDYTEYIDIVYYFWLVMPKLLTKLNNPKEKRMSRILVILQQIPIPTEHELEDIAEDTLLCFTKNKCKFKGMYSTIQESIQNLWNIIIRWKHTAVTHKETIIVLIENLMPHLSKPVLTIDYLMESLNAGGTTALFALQGIFKLVKDHNLEYPNIYGKLYSFFHPSIFCTKHRNKLYRLTSKFLSSTHLPETLVAAFVKRFARLCLYAPPHDIMILAAFIGNLIIRHPNLHILIQSSSERTASTDPYLDLETDPLKTRAIESSLWELQTLQQHVLPTVCSAVSFINKPLPRVEWDLNSLLDQNFDQILEQGSKKSIEKVALTFEEPKCFNLPRTSYFSDLWYFK